MSLTVLALVTGLGGPARGQLPASGGTARVAVLTAAARNPATDRILLDAFREAGWHEGRNLVVEFRAAEGRYDRLSVLAGELIRWQPHAILSVQTPSTQTLMKLTTTIPIGWSGTVTRSGTG